MAWINIKDPPHIYFGKLGIQLYVPTVKIGPISKDAPGWCFDLFFKTAFVFKWRDIYLGTAFAFEVLGFGFGIGYGSIYYPGWRADQEKMKTTTCPHGIRHKDFCTKCYEETNQH